MAIAGIGAQRDTLMSRSIVTGLRRRLPDEPVDRLPFDLHQQLLRARRQIARWAEDNAGRIAAMKSELPDCDDDRRRDNWTSLHRIAAALGGAWPDRIASAYAAQSQAQVEDTEPAGVMMLGDLAEILPAAEWIVSHLRNWSVTFFFWKSAPGRSGVMGSRSQHKVSQSC